MAGESDAILCVWWGGGGKGMRGGGESEGVVRGCAARNTPRPEALRRGKPLAAEPRRPRRGYFRPRWRAPSRGPVGSERGREERGERGERGERRRGAGPATLLPLPLSLSPSLALSRARHEPRGRGSGAAFISCRRLFSGRAVSATRRPPFLRLRFVKLTLGAVPGRCARLLCVSPVLDDFAGPLGQSQRTAHLVLGF
jgi:hypothetical protein